MQAEGRTDLERKPKRLREARYSLRELLLEVREEQREAKGGQEMVDQDEIGKLFTRKKRKRRGS